MNREEAFISAFEHLLTLGCQLPRIEEGTFLAEESNWRALYVFPFHPPCVIDVKVIADMAELNFHWEDTQVADTQGRNGQWQWLKKVIEAYRTGTTPSDSIPESYRFKSSRSKLSPTQFQWMKENLWTIPIFTIVSDDPKTAPERDGVFLRAEVRIGTNPTHKVDKWDDSSDDEAIYRYFRKMYQLACSALSDTDTKPTLLAMQRYFYGLKTMNSTEFVFPLTP